MVQYFLLNAALIFMPVFVAGLGTQFYRSQSANFISGWIGVACWPIGWGLWNIGTGAFCNLIKTFVADLGGLGVPAGAAIGSVVPGVGTVAGATAAGLLTLIVLAVFCLLLFVWVVAGAFIAPLLIQKMVTSGSNFFAGAMAAGGGAAAATVGTALKVGASFAAPGVGTAAAASAGASMQALGRGISGGGVDVGSMMGAAVPSMSDLADPAGAPSGRMYPKSETARRSAARSALRQVMS